jgi:leucyl aminopeptidase
MFMNISLKGLSILQEAKALLLPVFEKEGIHGESYPSNLTEILEKKATRKPFEGKKDTLSLLSFYEGELPETLILVGLGKKEDFSLEILSSSLAKGFQKAKTEKASSLTVDLSVLEELFPFEKILPVVGKTFTLANYEFIKFQREKEAENRKNSTEVMQEIYLFSKDEEQLLLLESFLAEGIHEGLSICIARDLVNEPANVLNPSTLARAAQQQGELFGFSVSVKNEKEVEDLGLEAFLSVGRGSKNSPKLIVMKYQGNDESDEIYGLVGKGLTFDSGGYSIKPTDGMLTMKMDMGGSAAVIGAMAAIAKQGLKVNITAVVAACENMISGDAFRPGDVIGSMAGKTIEITNTDAEGRLTLADAVTYAIEKEGATRIIDIATLTGAALVAMGKDITPYLCTDDEMAQNLEKAAEHSLEKVWRLPAEKSYLELLKSDIADIKNSGPRLAGTITAGLFVQSFTKDLPWLHLDIAGTAWTDKKKDLCPVGGTGAGAGLLYHYFKLLSL